MKSALLTAIVLVIVWTSGCGHSSGTIVGCGDPCAPTTAAPVISTTNAQNGAVIVSLADTTVGANIYYTVDGSTPTTSSQQYQAPFLIASTLTVKALAIASGTSSVVSVQAFTLSIPSNTLVWSDEFNNTTGVNAQPDPTIWTYDTGAGGWGNSELETYCAWNSSTAPCSAASPNAYVDPNGILHIVALSVGNQQYTSARMKTQGLFSFQYGRLEFSAKVPEEQGLWPANWTLGNNIATVNWPACGEQDVLERVNKAPNPDWNEGSVHGPGFTGGNLGDRFYFPTGQTAGSAFHTYEMDWSPGSVSYYIDDPSHLNPPYATFTPASLSSLTGASWPFDAGQSNFIILNLAVGGNYPGNPDGSTTFPAEMQVDYVRIYTN